MTSAPTSPATGDPRPAARRARPRAHGHRPGSSAYRRVVGRPRRRRAGHLRAALQHPGALHRAGRGLRRHAGPEHAVALPDHRRSRPDDPGARPPLGPARAHPAHPPLARAGVPGRDRLRAGAQLARPAGASAGPGRRPGGAARSRHGVPARGAAPFQPRPRCRPLHRGYGDRRHGRTARDRSGGRRGRLALGTGCCSGMGVVGRSSSACCSRPRTASCPADSGARAAVRRLRRALADPALLALYGIGATRHRRVRGCPQRHRLPAVRGALLPGRGGGQPRLPGLPDRLGGLGRGRAAGGGARASRRRPRRLRPRDRGAAAHPAVDAALARGRAHAS